MGARIAVLGASGNLGTAVLRRLAAEPDVSEVRGLCRRPPAGGSPYEGVRWFSADLSTAQSAGVLAETVAGCDAVVHLAWAIQPGRDPDYLRRVNVEGTRRVLEAVTSAGCTQLVYASSVGAYSPHQQSVDQSKGEPVDERWPVGGIRTSSYSRDKAAVEALLDRTEQSHPDLIVTRLRPTLVLQPRAASEMVRYFLGPLVRPRLIGWLRRAPGLILPLPRVLQLQFVHADDVADAAVRAIARRSQGAFNLAAEPILTPGQLAGLLGARHVPVPAAVLRAAVWLSYTLRLQPTEPGWLDMALAAPLLDSHRARAELGWSPSTSGDDALRELLEGMARNAGAPSPALRPAGR